jgi:hypothetical protein
MPALMSLKRQVEAVHLHVKFELPYLMVITMPSFAPAVEDLEEAFYLHVNSELP